jgi:deazaflavin-dependent oxidoreductase (nitroreductase family)
MNRDDFVAFLLRSPLNIFMGDTMLITVTGRKTGRKYTTPVGYFRENGDLWIMTSRDRTWWRNVRGGAQVSMRMHGHESKGYAETILVKPAVAEQVGEYIRHIPLAAKSLGVRLEKGIPNAEDAARIAEQRLFIRIHID